MRKQSTRKQEAGMTMIDFLFSFTVFLMIVSFIPFLIKLLHVEPSKASYDIGLFLELLGREVVVASDLTASGTTLFLTMRNGDLVSFEKFNSNIRRRVNGTGNEIYIQEVQAISYALVRNGVIVTVTKKGKTVEKRLSLAAPIFRDD